LKTILAKPRGQGAVAQAQPAADGNQAGGRKQSFVKSEIARWGKVVEAAGIKEIAVAALKPKRLGV